MKKEIYPDRKHLSVRLLEGAALFLKLGITAFGGPAAHTAIMHDETVKRRGWLSEEEFLDLVGATNLIPGPNSTEMAIHLGYRRAGWPGLIVFGACFILPAAIIVTVLASIYVQFGSTPQAGTLLEGIKPVVIAIILQALWSLGRKAMKNTVLAAVGLGVLVLYLIGVNEILLLFAAGVLVMLITNSRRLAAKSISSLLIPIKAELGSYGLTMLASTTFSLPILFLTFLKIGAILYGSGYVLLAFLRADFVERLGWLTEKQLIDAVAVGQLTPGPLFTTATFIGYILGGAPGAILATIGIFLPGFIFVAITNPIIPRLRASKMASSLLDGVNAASLGLMAGVTWQLGRVSINNLMTALIAIIAFVLLARFKINSTWLIIGGALVGVGIGIMN